MGAIPHTLTREQIQSIYERGPEEVTALIRHLQSEINSLTERTSKLEARLSFDSFLNYLDADRERAAERYNKLQQFLTSYFARRGSTDPESRAGETLEILCRQVAEGRVFEDLQQYSIGVARNVLLKERERDGSKVSLHDLQTNYDLRFSYLPQQSLTEKEADVSLHLGCMRTCVEELPQSDRELMTKYSGAGGHDKGTREGLAKEAGISLDAMRVKIHRIRAALKRCFLRCRKGGRFRWQ